MDTQAKLTAAQRLIKLVTGEPYGDGDVVTNYGVGYAEPGYHDDDTPWVLGNWNDKKRYDNDTQTRVTTSTAPSRLFDALERIGVQGEWSDEWTRCSHCQRIVRTSGDSYMWKPFYVNLPDGDVLCGTCALDDAWTDEVFSEYINRSDRVITWCDAAHLESLGWTRDNPREYQNGMHPGMNDKPAVILAGIQQADPTLDVVFWLDEASQFYIGFSAFTRPKQCQHDETDWADDDSNTLVCTDCGATRNPSLGPDGTEWTQR
jgi:hypothetical protein